MKKLSTCLPTYNRCEIMRKTTIELLEQIKKGSKDYMAHTISEVLNYDVPALCIVCIDPVRPIVPKRSNYKTPEGKMAHRPLKDMRPMSDREELKQIMSVSKE